MAEPVKRRRLAFDIDGVIADWVGTILPLINQSLGRDNPYHGLTSFNLANCLGVSEEDMHQLLAVHQSHEFYAWLPPVEGALEALSLLQEQYEVVAITSRKDVWRRSTEEWLARHLPDVKVYYGVGHNNPFAGEDGRLTKQVIAEELEAICLVEDNGEEFIDWRSETVEPICFAQPWNRSMADSHPHIRRLDWQGILDHYLA